MPSIFVSHFESCVPEEKQHINMLNIKKTNLPFFKSGSLIMAWVLFLQAEDQKSSPLSS